ncbi:hypothetical protein PG996_007273 [Apiospora saccharicola]|uniref:Uncharacterized protein n=1 Tax=Apiospora saccharicola TaxID=335842 RepID=A0ABR1VAD1_9PEZI
MLEFHDLCVIDDETLRSGATSHQVRDHFRSWVPANLEDRLRSDAADLEDDSVNHPGCNSPVVKLLHKDWESPFPPQERNHKVPAPFHDGATEYEEEDLGWMYMPVQDYLGK